MPPQPSLLDLRGPSDDENDAVIRVPWEQARHAQALVRQVEALTVRVAELEAKLGTLPKTSGNPTLPPSKG